VGLEPKSGCLVTLAYYVFPRYELGKRRGKDIDRGNRTRRKTYPSATLYTINLTWIDPGAKLGLRGERQATNDLRHELLIIIICDHKYQWSICLWDSIQATNTVRQKCQTRENIRGPEE
jgi:hypothetical protein